MISYQGMYHEACTRHASDEGYQLYEACGCYGGNDLVAKQLIKKGANVEWRNEDGCTPLMAAAINGYIGIVRLLLDNKANINAKNDLGWMALHMAVNICHDEMVRLLIERGADLYAKDIYGSTPLNVAKNSSYCSIVEIIEKAMKSKNGEDSL